MQNVVKLTSRIDGSLENLNTKMDGLNSGIMSVLNTKINAVNATTPFGEDRIKSQDTMATSCQQ